MEVLHGTQNELEEEAVSLIATEITRLDSVVLGLVSGRSVRGLYEKLYSADIDWSKVHIFMVDERCVPVTSEESNFHTTYEGFLRGLVNEGKLPEENIHEYHFEEIHDDSCLQKYNEEFEKFGRHFDIVILSAGEDGHIASLFPNHVSIKNEEERFIEVDRAPKAPARRITAARKLLENADMGMLLFFGEQKRKAFQKFQDDRINVIECPAKIAYKMREAYALRDLTE